ncbi:hypothetical protein [Xanthobacter sediminis]
MLTDIAALRPEREDNSADQWRTVPSIRNGLRVTGTQKPELFVRQPSHDMLGLNT